MSDAVVTNPQTKCCKPGCGEDATLTPEIHVWAKGYAQGSHEPAKLTCDLKYCDDCAMGIKRVDDILSDEGKEMLAASFKAIKRAKPSWKTAKVRWQLIGETGE